MYQYEIDILKSKKKDKLITKEKLIVRIVDDIFSFVFVLLFPYFSIIILLMGLESGTIYFQDILIFLALSVILCFM